MIDPQLNVAARLAIASLIGIASGLEREWSGHTTGPDARFAGIRTFFLLGLLGGIAGTLSASQHAGVAAALALGAVALCVAAYTTSVRRAGAHSDGTTETAALTVVGLGVVAGTGAIAIAAGAGALVVLMLREKERLHLLVRQLAEPELRAGLQFAVLAVVVLPLLPVGPYLGALAVKPRTLWMIVLIFSALNFAGFIARRVVGANRGLGIAGALGGVLSSTAVTLTFSRQSRDDETLGAPLARGVIAACTVLVPRVLVVSAVINIDVALALLPMVLLPFVVGMAFVLVGWHTDAEHDRTMANGDLNPLRLGVAIQMAVAFQVAILAIAFVQTRWGTPGVYATAAALGFTDVDALTVSMSRRETALVATSAAHAIAIGILSNTLLKLTVISVVGRSTFRRRAGVGLTALAAASALGLLLP
jgi:uncharacterized membrane protein (DUF4010 family)